MAAKRNASGQFVSRKKGTSVARRSTSAPKTRTRTVTKVKVVRRNSGGGGFGGGWLPPKDDLWDIAGAGTYGVLERQFKAGKDKGGIGYTVLNAVPKFVDALGFTGNVGLVAWGVAKVTKNKYARHFAKGTLSVAAYKLGAKGEMYKKADELSGLPASIGSLDQEVARGAAAADAESIGEFDPHEDEGDTYRPD